ncbi:pentatricopeptide repeat-containing protein [Tanacetum coccineum]
MRKDAWYEPDHSLYADLMLISGKKKLINRVEKLFAELKSEGLELDIRAYTELIGAYLKVEMIDKAIETYELMKASGCVPDELTLMIMIRNLESAGRDDLTVIIKNDCVKYLDSPKKFLNQSPVEFIDALIESQGKDLKLAAGETSRNVEKEHQAEFYNQPCDPYKSEIKFDTFYRATCMTMSMLEVVGMAAHGGEIQNSVGAMANEIVDEWEVEGEGGQVLARTQCYMGA